MSTSRLGRRTFLGGIAVAGLAACDRSKPGTSTSAHTGRDATANADAVASADAGFAPDAAPTIDSGAVNQDAQVAMMDAGATADAGPSFCGTTNDDALGPFHRPNAPFRTMIASSREPGDRLLVEGRVVGSDCQPVAGAIVDVWQADRDGNYDQTSTDYRLRGRMRTDTDGRFAFESIRPGHYPLGNSMRPAHLHVIVEGAAFPQVTTQIYFTGDPFLSPNDPCGGSCDSGDPDRIIDLAQADMNGVTRWHGNVDLVVQTG